jgi:hypothetical protein
VLPRMVDGERGEALHCTAARWCQREGVLDVSGSNVVGEEQSRKAGKCHPFHP